MKRSKNIEIYITYFAIAISISILAYRKKGVVGWEGQNKLLNRLLFPIYNIHEDDDCSCEYRDMIIILFVLLYFVLCRRSAAPAGGSIKTQKHSCYSSTQHTRQINFLSVLDGPLVYSLHNFVCMSPTVHFFSIGKPRWKNSEFISMIIIIIFNHRRLKHLFSIFFTSQHIFCGIPLWSGNIQILS